MLQKNSSVKRVHEATLRKDIGIQIVGALLNMAALAVVTPLLIYVLGPARYGTFVLISGLTLFTALTDIGVSKAAQIRLSREIDDREEVSIVSSSLCLSLILALLGGIFLCLFTHYTFLSLIAIPIDIVSEIEGAWFVLFALGALTNLTLLPQCLLAAKARFYETNLLAIVSTLSASLLPALVAFAGQNNVAALLSALVAARVASLMFGGWLAARALPLTIGCPDAQECATLFRLGAFITTNSAMELANSATDRYILAGFTSSASVPILSIPQSLLARAGMFGSAVATAGLPRIGRAGPSARNDLLKKLAEMIICLAPIYCATAAIVTGLLSYWISRDFSILARDAALLLVVSSWIEQLSALPFYFLQVTQRPELNVRASAILLAPNVAITIALVAMFGVEGAAFAAVIRASALLALRLFFVGIHWFPAKAFFAQTVLLILTALAVNYQDNLYSPTACVIVVASLLLSVHTYRRLDRLVTQ